MMLKYLSAVVLSFVLLLTALRHLAFAADVARTC